MSDVDGRPSVVADGPEEGVTLGELVRRHGADLVGGRVLERFGSRFPLLVKFIDARDDLSVQVHPDDNLAHARHGALGKTEMWYVVQAAPGAALYSGFSRPIDADEFRRRVEERTIMEVLKRYEVRPGDVFFLPAGRVHAIGAGCFVAEIQQTSDVTYRIYDYDRVGADGRKRELHVAEALEAIDYTFYADHRQPYTPRYDVVVKLIHCPYFTTHLLDLTTLPMTRDFARLDSFVIYLCMAGG
ncbi:mannose-6-phosphate isomerase, partial [Tannerella sp. oral taxon BU063 isolate Cell 2]